MTTLSIVAAVTLLAFAVKAATGFGPALVVVAFGSLVIGPVDAIILAAFLDVASGTGVAWIDRDRIRRERWVAPATTIAIGAVIGAALLEVVPVAGLRRLVGIAVVGFGAWLFGIPAPETDPARSPAASRLRPNRFAEHAAAALGGLSGGLVGVGGPPIILYYGAHLPKLRFRAMIVPILLVAALFRAGTYLVTGQVDRGLLPLLAVSLPALPLGLWLGNRLFRRFSEDAFRRIVALAVTLIGLRLLL